MKADWDLHFENVQLLNYDIGKKYAKCNVKVKIKGGDIAMLMFIKQKSLTF